MNLFPKANQLQPYKALHREIIVYFPKKHYTCNYKTIYITANQQQYYLKYKNLRADYVQAFYNVIDWKAVAANYEQVQNG